MTAKLAIGIDLGGTNLKIAVVSQVGDILAKRNEPTDLTQGPDLVIAKMVALVKELCTEVAVEVSQMLGVGVGSPGPLSPSEGRIIQAANLPGWANLPLRDRLADQLKSVVMVDNDGNAAALGEWWAGVGERKDDLVMLTLGTGIGGGVILNGNILHGHYENAAELGHMIVVPDGLPCSCGKRGCLERYASAACVASRAMEAIQQGERSLLSEQVTRDEPITAQDVAQASLKGDALCERIWDEACRYLAISCINIQHTFNPKHLVLGGGLAEADDYLIGRIKDHVSKMQWKLHHDSPAISRGQLGYDAGVIGAAALLLHRV